MSTRPEADPATEPDAAKCLARSVADALAENPLLEAVTINRARHTISLATLGQADVPKLTERISATVQRAQEASEQTSCTLLAGDGVCAGLPGRQLVYRTGSLGTASKARD